MRSGLLVITPLISLALAAFVACSSPNGQINTVPPGSSGSSGDTSGGSGATSSGTANSGAAAGSGVTGGSGMTGGSGTSTSGASASGSASSGTASSGATSGASSGSGSGASSGMTSGGPLDPLPSAGCGIAPTIPTGKYVAQPMNCDQGAAQVNCQAIPVGSMPVQKPAKGAPEWRGWWVQLPANYDPRKPYRVIYNGAGCFDPNWFHAGADGLPYQNFDNNEAILVGLDYDTYSDLLGCYDNRSPNSNDFTFFPWLQAKIESQYCVDIHHEYWSGYSSGGWVAQQFNCAFPDKLRGTVAVTGCEPGAPGYPGSQPMCVSKPSAALFAKDLNDPDNTYACIIPACQRVLQQNGCMVNGAVPKCDPQDKTLTTPYPIPASLANVVKGSTVNLNCVEFNGCPADYPVTFCYYTDATNKHGDTQSWGGPALYWDWMRNRLAK